MFSNHPLDLFKSTNCESEMTWWRGKSPRTKHGPLLLHDGKTWHHSELCKSVQQNCEWSTELGDSRHNNNNTTTTTRTTLCLSLDPKFHESSTGLRGKDTQEEGSLMWVPPPPLERLDTHTCCWRFCNLEGLPAASRYQRKTFCGLKTSAYGHWERSNPRKKAAIFVGFEQEISPSAKILGNEW